MAKTQKEIMNALLGALEKGEGDLSSLDALMDQVKADIAEAKAEEHARKEKEEARMKKRGEEIAAMATRVLNEQTTDADLALVMESYMHARGMKDAKITAEDVVTATQAAEKATSIFDDLLKAFDSIGSVIESKPTITRATKKKTSDDILKEFLNTIQ